VNASIEWHVSINGQVCHVRWLLH